jgi:hypothetical protein
MKLDDKGKEKLADYIPRDGSVLRDLIEEHFSKSGIVFVEEKEISVNFDNSKRRIDLVLKAKLPEVCQFEIFFVIEAKSINKNFATVILTGDEANEKYFTTNLLGADIDRGLYRGCAKKLIGTECKLASYSEFYLIDKFDLIDDNSKSKRVLSDIKYYHEGREDRTLVQIFANTQGFLDKLIHENNYSEKNSVGINTFVIPLIVTNTDLYSAKVCFDDHNFEEGVIDQKKIKISEIPWAIINYSEMPNSYGREHTARFEQSIFITNTANVDELIEYLVKGIVKSETKFDVIRKNQGKLYKTDSEQLREMHNAKFGNKRYLDIFDMFRKQNLFNDLKVDLESRFEEGGRGFNRAEFEKKFDELLTKDVELLRLAIYLTTCFCSDKLYTRGELFLEQQIGNNFYALLEDMLFLLDDEELILEIQNP